MMQRNINLSIQFPNDKGSLLPVHSDVWSGDSPYEINLWLPLVDCYRTKSMYLLPQKKYNKFEKRIHYEKNKMILYFWTVIISVFVFDVYFERITGANIFGWGAISLNGIPQPHGIRVVSFFKDEPIAGAFMNGFISQFFTFFLF